MQRVWGLGLLLIACHSAPGGSDPPPRGDWPPQRTQYQNPIPAENQQPGDAQWHSGFTNSWNRQIEGFADRVSAAAGDTVLVRAHADIVKTGKWTLYRLGWYGGAGARKIAEGATTFYPQQPCGEDTTTGLVHCENWTPTIQVTIPQNAVSGLYVIRLLRDDNYGAFVNLVVRDQRPADLLFQSSVTTMQAYNSYGGESLYTDADDGIAGHMAVQVSFDRPYKGWMGTGDLLRWEVHAARFLEREGYDVTYTTNLDVVREGLPTIAKRGAFLSVGHDEYWAGEERDIVEHARDAGVPLLFLGANPAYWKVRLSAPGADGNARVITCYKVHPELDPLHGTPDQTGRFRDAAINRPEEELVGVMYEGWMFFGQPWVVNDASHFLFAGTGMQDGDAVPRLVGYEYDRTFSGGTPGAAAVIARSPVVDAESKPGVSESTFYTGPNGASVFGAGTIYWSLGLEGPQADARIQRITANALNAMLKLPIPADLQTVTPPHAAQVDGAWATSVTTVARGLPGPAGLAQLPDGSLLVADARAHRIFKIVNGAPVPFAGDGNPSGDAHYDNVPALQARFFQPTSVAVDSSGRVFVADTHNNCIRLIDTNGMVSTFAGGLFVSGYADGTGTAARFSDPMGLSWLDATHLLIADNNNHAIRKLDLTTRAVTTLAITHGNDDADGTTQTASFYFPTATAASADGRVFFVASQSGKVKVIGTDGSLTSLTQGGFGLADGVGTGAQLLPQGGLVWDGTGLVVSDAGNQRLRRVTVGSTAATSRVQTLAGSGSVGVVDGPAASAAFGVPIGLFRASDGTLFVADGGGAVRAVAR